MTSFPPALICNAVRLNWVKELLFDLPGKVSRPYHSSIKLLAVASFLSPWKHCNSSQFGISIHLSVNLPSIVVASLFRNDKLLVFLSFLASIQMIGLVMKVSITRQTPWPHHNFLFSFKSWVKSREECKIFGYVTLYRVLNYVDVS